MTCRKAQLKTDDYNMTNSDVKPCTDVLKEGEFFILDAPGINGMGSNSSERLQKHIEEGGTIIHKMRPDENGIPQFVNPKGMWPEANN